MKRVKKVLKVSFYVVFFLMYAYLLMGWCLCAMNIGYTRSDAIWALIKAFCMAVIISGLFVLFMYWSLELGEECEQLYKYSCKLADRIEQLEKELKEEKERHQEDILCYKSKIMDIERDSK